MHENNDIWRILSRIYLTDHEIMKYVRESKRNELVDLTKNRLFEDIWRRMKRWGEKSRPFINEPRESRFIKYDRKAEIIESENVEHAFMEIKPDGFLIFVNKNKPTTLKRTLIAHELGHTFLFNLNKNPIEPYYNKSQGNLYMPKDSITYKKYEGLPYEIGRFILAPTEAIKMYVPKVPSLSRFLDACNAFRITKELMARRLLHDIDYWRNTIAIFYSTDNIKKGEYKYPPRNEVYRGADVKDSRKFDIKSKWSLLTRFIDMSLNNPNELITSDEYHKGIEFGQVEFRVEAMCISKLQHPIRRIYVFLYPVPVENHTYINGK